MVNAEGRLKLYFNALNAFDLKQVEAMFAEDAVYVSAGLNAMKIGRAEIIKESHSSVAGPGSTIEVVEGDGSAETFHLVGAVESDPSAGRISIDSPVGRALVGKKKGDKVTVNVPQGSLTLTIKAVK